MNWLVSHFNKKILKIKLQSCCFPSRKEALIKDNEIIKNDYINNNKNNLENEQSKYNQ